MTRLLLFGWLYLCATFILMFAVHAYGRLTGRDCKPLFRWFDMWVGAYWDATGRKLYIFPMPMLGVVLDCGQAFQGLTYTDTRSIVPGIGWAVYRQYQRQDVMLGSYELRADQSPSLAQAAHTTPVMRALLSSHPSMTVKEAMDLWDNRRAA
ncbi:hypothetical protein [uncultured Paludibaculum sp.]|uniref:hypothetical protein n=1 Tax=uncultured Paludibaculum sp. TaxID=1765020 RepID=UPI002AAB5B74|nr:hypothetical protein [uncultured Paludibaculum sp.]